MSRIRLRSPDQPWLVRLLLGTYEFCASLRLAVFLILSSAAVLGFATFVESKLGLGAVHFGIYGTWWFGMLNALLALNIFCAATIRFPWKRHQTGFVITHIGLLTLLTGCLMSRLSGIDAQMPIWEDGTNRVAAEDNQSFLLSLHPHASADIEKSHDGRQVESVRVPFAAGPFNWDDLDDFWMTPWRLLAHRDTGVLYDRDGVRLEVLDYYSDSVEVDVPRVKLQLSMPPSMRTDPTTGKEVAMPEVFIPGELTAERPGLSMASPERRDRIQMGGGTITFWATDSDSETKAFLDSRPEGEIGTTGQVVLYADGVAHRLSIADHLDGDAVPLGESGLEAQIVKVHQSEQPRAGSLTAVELTIGNSAAASEDDTALDEENEPNEDTTSDEETAPNDDTTSDEEPVSDDGANVERMLLFADRPELNQQGRDHGVYGTYWVDRGEISAADRMNSGASRIDILEGADGRLYYRYWNRKQVVALTELPSDGKRVDAFSMPMGTLKLFVAEHIAASASGRKILPLPFNKQTTPVNANRAAKIRLTVDGNSEELWLTGPRMMFGLGQKQPSSMRSVEGDGRSATVLMPLDEIDVGFDVKLLKFTRKLDPGTQQAADFSSNVDFIDNGGHTLARDVLITMNAPVDFSDPERGRSYRLFQEAYQGPFGPDLAEYRIHYGRTPLQDRRDRIYISILTVNYDPGRWVKYAGCYLIVAGILTMFYMRAYFFKPAADRPAASAS